MGWVAWKMLTGDRAKYLGTIFGVAFGTLLIAQQTSIFVGLMSRTASQIMDIREAVDLGDGSRGAKLGRNQTAVGERRLSRARRQRRVVGRAALQGAGPGAGRRRKLSPGDADGARRRHAGRRAERDDRGLAGRFATPRRGDRRQGGLRLSLARRTDGGGQAAGDERPPRGRRRHLQGVGPVSDLSGDVLALYPGHGVRGPRTKSDVVRPGAAGEPASIDCRSLPPDAANRRGCWP